MRSERWRTGDSGLLFLPSPAFQIHYCALCGLEPIRGLTDQGQFYSYDDFWVCASRQPEPRELPNVVSVLEYWSWKMFVRESFTAVQMAIAGIYVETRPAKYSCCIRRTSQRAGESQRLSWPISLQEDTVLSNKPSWR
jgi:hypothetical protein